MTERDKEAAIIESDEAKKNQKVFINKSWCKDCGICKEFCPRSIFSVNSKGRVIVEDAERCILCGICQLRCPDFAITLKEKDDND